MWTIGDRPGERDSAGAVLSIVVGGLAPVTAAGPDRERHAGPDTGPA
jgi:hypothetical protein